MNEPLDDAANQRYRGTAENKEPVVEQDILWITPKRLAWLFGAMLVMSVVVNGF